MLQILDTRMGFPSPSLNVVFDYFSHSCLKMCKKCLKRTLDATFLDCLALTFCDVIGELLPEWACLTLQGGTTFLLTSKLADIPVSRVRISSPKSKNISLSTVASLVSEIEWVKKLAFIFRDVSFTCAKNTIVLRQSDSLTFVSRRVTKKIKKRLNCKQMTDDRWFFAD